MNIVDPKGLLEGERLAACSDNAQLHWQRLYVAANGYARLELSYSGIISSVYRSFKNPPSEDQLWGFFEEFAANFLAILYQVDGVWWAQFDTSAKYMPRYKTARDENSPGPTVELLDHHRNGYREWKKSKSIQNQRFQKFSENLGSVPKVSAAVAVVGVVVGAGAEVQNVSKTTSSHPEASLGESEANSDLSIYKAYPRKVGKKAALISINKAIKRLVKGEFDASPMSPSDARQSLMDSVQEYARSAVGSQADLSKIPNPATWFNQGRYDDDRTCWECADGSGDSNRGAAVGRVQRSVDAWDRVAAERHGEITPEMITRAVCELAPLSGADVISALNNVCRAEMKSGMDTRELQGALIAAWKDFAENRRKFSCTFGAAKFFGEGLWKDRLGWPWREGMEPPRPRVFVNAPKLSDKMDAQLGPDWKANRDAVIAENIKRATQTTN
jgi:hypothetical protein